MTRSIEMVVIVAAALAVPVGVAQASFCSKFDNDCPETSRSYNKLIITDLFGTPQSMTGNDNYEFGTWSGVMVACNMTTNLIYFLKDDTDGSYPSALLADSALCMGSGSDIVTVAATSFTCASQTISAFSYGSDRIFHIHGQSGMDVLTGGAGRDKLCGGSERDILDGQGATDEVDGLSGGDRIQGGGGSNDDLWGYSGVDCLIDLSGSGELLRSEGDDDACVWDDSGTFSSLDCGSGGGDTPNTSGTSNCSVVSESACWAACLSV